MSAATVGAATTLLMETAITARVTLASGEAATFDVYEADNPAGPFVRSLDDEGNGVSVSISAVGVRGLPQSLDGAGWLRFVGPAREIRAKVVG